MDRSRFCAPKKHDFLRMGAGFLASLKRHVLSRAPHSCKTRIASAASSVTVPRCPREPNARPRVEGAKGFKHARSNFLHSHKRQLPTVGSIQSESGPRLGGAAVLYPAGGVGVRAVGIVTPGLRLLPATLRGTHQDFTRPDCGLLPVALGCGFNHLALGVRHRNAKPVSPPILRGLRRAAHSWLFHV